MSWPNRMGPLQFRPAVSIVLPQALQPYFFLGGLHFEEVGLSVSMHFEIWSDCIFCYRKAGRRPVLF